MGIKILASLIFTFLHSYAYGQTPAKPNDPYFSQQWYLFNDGTQTVDIDTDESHTIIQKGKAGIDIGWLQAKDEMNRRAKAEVILALIDSGIDYNNDELEGRIVEGGWDFLNNSPLTGDSFGHGTHNAGLIAANADNGKGIAGIAPSTVKILPLKVLPADCTSVNKVCYQNYLYNGKTVSDYTADAVKYAVEHKAKVISISLGWPGMVDTSYARTTFEAATKAGVVIVASAGNNRKTQAPYPCGYKGVICVGAVTNTGAMSIYSDHGGAVDILAPGDDIVSIFPKNLESQQTRVRGLDIGTGTSESGPQVAAVAAAIQSVYPDIKDKQVEARLLGSTQSVDDKKGSLFGIVKLGKALAENASPVFWPQFRTMDIKSITENDLKTSGTLKIEDLRPNLGGKPVHVTATVWINKKLSGQLNGISEPNGEISIPWTYQFKSLDDPADLSFTVTITKDDGTSQSFYDDTFASRNMLSLAGNKTSVLQGVNSSDVLGKDIYHYFSKLSQVENIFSDFGSPIYYRQSTRDPKNNSSTIQLFNTSKNEGMVTLNIPGIQKITEVVEADFFGDGRKDLAVVGVGKTQKTYLEFYFLNSDLQSLTGTSSGSVWQIPLDDNPFLSSFLISDDGTPIRYNGPGSWVPWMDPFLNRTRLIPASFSTGILPDKDNVNAFNPAHYEKDKHLYYLVPISKPNSDTQPTQLEIRAVDNSTFRRPYDELHLTNVIQPSRSGSSLRPVQVLAEEGHNPDSPVGVFNVPSVNKPSLVSSPWDAISASGQPFGLLSDEGHLNGSAYFDPYNESQAEVAWSSNLAAFGGRTEFRYVFPLSPILNLLGAFNLKSDRYFFVETTYDIVGYRLSSADGSLKTEKTSIQRESSFPESEFKLIFTPMTVGTTARPLPGIFENSAWVQGNSVSIVIWDPDKNTTYRPLRYFLEIPDGCAEMPTTYLNNQVESLAMSLICNGASQTDPAKIILVKPH